MAIRTITEVRNAVVTALQRIKVANGFTFDLPDANIIGNYDPKFEDRKEDANYPKAMLILDDGTNSDLPSRKKDKSLVFLLVLVDKAFLQSTDETTGIDVYDVPSEQKAERMLDAIDQMLANNISLGNTVESCTIEGFTTDSGYTHPEATSVVRLIANYKKQF
jgi:hypothetical protein